MSNFPRGNSLLQNCFSLISSSQHCSRSASTHFPSSGKNLLQNCITTVLLLCSVQSAAFCLFSVRSIGMQTFPFSFQNSVPDYRDPELSFWSRTRAKLNKEKNLNDIRPEENVDKCISVYLGQFAPVMPIALTQFIKVCHHSIWIFRLCLSVTESFK